MAQFLSRSLLPLSLSLCLMLGTLAGCADLPAGNGHKSAGFNLSSLSTSQTDALLLYLDNVRRAGSAEQAREFDKARQAYAQSASDLNRIRLAGLLALPVTSFHDAAAALALLNDLPREAKAGQSPLHALANVLQVTLVEQQRMAAANDEAMQKYKDEQKRADALQQQINGIKRMEKNMMQRDKR